MIANSKERELGDRIWGLDSGTNIYTGKETIMKLITKKLRTFVREEEGLTTVEYAVAGGLIALAVVGAFQALGGTVGGVITGIDAAIGG